MRRPWRRRRFVGLWVVLLAATGGGSLARAGQVVPGVWDGPQVLATTSEPARSPVLAVTAGGQAIAGWLGGPAPPAVSVPPAAPARSTESSSSSWAGQTVFVDRGTLAGGFRAPIAIAGPLREHLQLSVAVSGAGTVYAVWHVFAGSGMVSAAPPGDPFSAPRELSPAGDELVAVVQSPGGPVAAVWAIPERGSRAPLLSYDAVGRGRQSGAGGERGEGSGAPVRRAFRAERPRRARGCRSNEQRRSRPRTDQHGCCDLQQCRKTLQPATPDPGRGDRPHRATDRRQPRALRRRHAHGARRC